MKNTLLDKCSQSLLGAARKGIVAAVAVLSLSAITASADQFIVESDANGQHSDWLSRSGTWASSSGKVTAEGASAAANTWFIANVNAKATVTPVFGTPGGTYDLDLAYPGPTTTVAGHGVGINQTGCTGLPAFSDAPTKGHNKWNPVGRLVLASGANTATLEFFWPTNNGTPTGSFYSDRIYVTCLRFTQISPCTNTPALPTVRTPLVQDQMWVDVPGVASNATAVYVYTDWNDGSGWQRVGSKTSGISQGLNRVTLTSPLVTGIKVTATQVVGPYEGCLPPNGPVVGSGANPRLRVNFMISHDTGLAGPVGAATTAPPITSTFYLGSMSLLGGFGSAPSGGTVLDPSVVGPCWQTVTLSPVTDFQCRITDGAAGTAVPSGTFGALTGISIANEAADSGPYNIYIDNIMSGTNVIEDFENVATNTTGMFQKPSSWTTTSANTMSAQNYSLVVGTNADTGKRCVNLFWQYSSAAGGNFFNIFFSGTNGVNYPQIDMTQPITMRMLVMGPGTNINDMTVGQPPAKVGVRTNATYVFDGTATGVGPFTYQWSKNGEALSNGGKISGATTAKLTVSNILDSELGSYQVAVSSSSSCAPVSSNPSLLMFVTDIAPDQKFSISAKTASSITLGWTNGVLQFATELRNTNTVWTDISTAAPPFVVPTTSGTKFYRLRGQ